MKTPIQKLLNSYQNCIDKIDDNEHSEIIIKTLKLCKSMAELFLNEEKDIIKAAYCDGMLDFNTKDETTPESYFKELYNN